MQIPFEILNSSFPFHYLFFVFVEWNVMRIRVLNLLNSDILNDPNSMPLIFFDLLIHLYNVALLSVSDTVSDLNVN